MLRVADDFSSRHSGANTLVLLTTILLNVVVFSRIIYLLVSSVCITVYP